MTQTVLHADARRLPLADASVHMVVTSPPYFGLRCYGVDGQIGLERTPEAYIAEMVKVFREVKRVLRGDGTLWLNIGDSYVGGGRGGGGSFADERPGWDGVPMEFGKKRGMPGVKPKDLIGIPWQLAFALRADGWYLRQDIIWHKPNPMPESVRDRCTKAHEYIFLMSKSARYYYDADAIREKPSGISGGLVFGGKNKGVGMRAQGIRIRGREFDQQDRDRYMTTGANGRDVWKIPTESFSGSHFATFPVKLPWLCIQAGTSDRGCCPTCGAWWRRTVERMRSFESGSGRSGNPINGKQGAVHGGGETIDIRRGPTVATHTTGWSPSCKCPDHEPIPCTVLDPFHGAGTTAIAAEMLGRSYVGTELKREYIDLSLKRIEKHRHRRIHGKPPKPRRLPLEATLFTMEAST